MVATSFPYAGPKALRAVSALICGAQAFVREAEGDNSAVQNSRIEAMDILYLDQTCSFLCHLSSLPDFSFTFPTAFFFSPICDDFMI